MFDLDNFFYYLTDSAFLFQRKPDFKSRNRRFAVLRDMTGPTGLALERTIIAHSFKIPDGWNEVDVAIHFRENYDYFAFYMLKDNVIRAFAAKEEELDQWMI